MGKILADALALSESLCGGSADICRTRQIVQLLMQSLGNGFGLFLRGTRQGQFLKEIFHLY